MRKLGLALIAAGSLAAAGCATYGPGYGYNGYNSGYYDAYGNWVPYNNGYYNNGYGQNPGTATGAVVGAGVGGVGGALLTHSVGGAVAGAVLGGVLGAVIGGHQYYRDTRGYCYYVDQYGQPHYSYDVRC